MKFKNVFHTLMFLLRIRTLATVNSIYNYPGIILPHDCIFEFDINPLLRTEQLPFFNDINFLGYIQPGLDCAEQFFQLNSKLGNPMTHEWRTIIETPRMYILGIRNALFLNNNSESFGKLEYPYKIDKEGLLATYYKLQYKYAINLQESAKDLGLGLVVHKEKFIDANEFPTRRLREWSKLAKWKKGYHDSTSNGGPWLVPYNELRYLIDSTKSDDVIRDALNKLAQGGRKSPFDNKDVLYELRELYKKYARRYEYGSIVDYKMKFCVFDTIESIKKFLQELETSVAYKYMMDPHSIKYMKEVEENLAGYFPHNHVVKELFQLIYELFQITIRESTIDYETYADGVKLYEVYDSTEKIGLFYIDYFQRPGKKIALKPYTAPLKFRARNYVIPLVIISLQTQSENYFSLPEIRSLYHEMGHCLQLILGIPYKLNTQSDTHEFPSMLMELFAKQKPVILRLMDPEIPVEEKSNKYYQYYFQFKKWNRYVLLKDIQTYLIDLSLYSSSEDSDVVIRNVRENFHYKQLNDMTYCSDRLPLFNYAGTMYAHLLSEIMAIDAYNHLYSDPTKVRTRGLEFRRLVLELNGVNNVPKAFLIFLGRKEMGVSIERFYKFYDI